MSKELGQGTASVAVIDLTSDDDARMEMSRRVRTGLKRWMSDISSHDSKPPARKRARVLDESEEVKSEAPSVFGRTFEPLPLFHSCTIDHQPTLDACTLLLCALGKDENDSNTDPNEQITKWKHDRAVGKTDPNERNGQHDKLGSRLGKTGPNERNSKGQAELPLTLGQEASDRWLAHQLQDQLDKELREQEEKQMRETVTGRAYMFVDKVLALNKKVHEMFKDFPNLDKSIAPVAFDDMVYTAERMMNMQEEFAKSGKPVQVDIGYHYTKGENFARIQTNGLMSYAERQKSNIVSNYNGSLYGDGIYTAKNPFAYHGKTYGDMGLLVARLQGTTMHNWEAQNKFDFGNDCIIAKEGANNEIAVLRTSSQCVPVIQYAADLVDQQDCMNRGNQVVETYVRMLQVLIDEFFNDGVQVHKPSPHDRPKMSSPVTPGTSAQSGGTLHAPMPATTVTNAQDTGWSASAATSSAPVSAPLLALQPTLTNRSSEVYIGSSYYQAPMTLDDFSIETALEDMEESTSTKECPICLDALCSHKDSVSVKACGHEFHRHCIQDSLKYSSSCPICRKAVVEPRGKMPSGDMKVTYLPDVTCSGYDQGTIKIKYYIPRGYQKCYHDNPGQWHGGAQRIAYLPNNREGQKLLMRLKYAFQHGLTFTVGTSLTSGISNSVTWSSIHHKTSTAGGPHGFPDSGFFMNCNEELDALGVPPADDL